VIEVRKIFRITSGRVESVEDYIAQEEFVEVVHEGKVLTRHALSPSELIEWAVGYLYTNLLIKDLAKVKIREENGKVLVEGEINLDAGFFWTGTSGCGSSIQNLCMADLPNLKDVQVHFPISRIFEIFEEFNQKSINFKLAGSLHSSAIFDESGILYFSEDIARHNSVDKVIGKALIEGRELSKTFLLTSGRISSEIVRKSLVAKIPIIVSHSAPTTFAIDLAQAAGITLIGFLRGKKCNIYTESDRISVP